MLDYCGFMEVYQSEIGWEKQNANMRSSVRRCNTFGAKAGYIEDLYQTYAILVCFFWLTVIVCTIGVCSSKPNPN